MEFIETLVTQGWLAARDAHLGAWFQHNVLTMSLAWQAMLTAMALAFALVLTPTYRRLCQRAARQWPATGRLKGIWRDIHATALPVLWLAAQWIAALALAEAGQPSRAAKTIVSLLAAWLVIRFFTAFFAETGWSRLVTLVAWTVAALDITGLLKGAIRILDGIGLDMGGVRLSLLVAIKAFLALTILLWLVRLLSRLLEKRIMALPNLTPSAQVLFTKVSKVTLFGLGAVVAMKSVGIDLSAFALLSGAIGLGVGFGLQKVVSNLVSGWILLLDKSIKPGDVISVGDGYGWIASLGARYVSVVTRDGIEHLIPNEDLITQRVQNWSFSHNRVRLKIPVGVAYGTDLPKAMALCVEAAKAAPRILPDPAPVCLFTGFGASSLDLEVRCWIDDPRNGVTSAKSGVLLGIWTRFRTSGIEVPYGQTDLHIRSLPPEFLAGLPEANT